MSESMHKRFKILIVDDEPRNLRILEKILEQHELEKAVDGEQALQLLDEFKPELILLDGMMPGMSGIDVCEKLKMDEKYQHIKIIIVSGKASEVDFKEAAEVGADGYVTKPFTVDELLTAVQRVVS